MATPVGSVTTTAATPSAGDSASKPLDRQAFLKLLVAQISHQDPLQPMQGTEFVTQLSQFAMVEQAIAQSTSLETVSTQIRGLSNSEATSLVGKTVTMRGSALAYDGVTAATSAATLEGPSSKTTAQIVDASGKVVRTIELGPRPSGPLAVTWDGKDDVGLAAPKGTYSLKIAATDASGNAVATTQDVSGTVVKVTFEKGYPELTLDNGATGAIADLVGVKAPPAAK